MGIEDFSLDLGEHAERVLIISSHDGDSDTLCTLLTGRAYSCVRVGSLIEASDITAQCLFDLAIVNLPDLDCSPRETVEFIIEEQRLRRLPLVIIHRDADELEPITVEGLSLPVQFIRRPIERTSVLVKVAHQLRLRKLRADEGRFFSKVASDNVELRDLTSRFKRELIEAQEIQNTILPTSLPSHPAVDFAAAYVPLEAVGGDLYDVWKIDEHRFGIFIGDVTGHGLPAAFIGAMTKMALGFGKFDSPEVILEAMNGALSKVMPDGRFVTAAMSIYDARSGELRTARGGHPAPVVYRSETREVEQIAPRGFPLGVMPVARYECHTTVINPGDTVIFVTDGITETTNLDGKILGTEGLCTLVTEAAQHHAIADCLASLLDAQEAFSQGRRVKDDITLIGFERVSQPGLTESAMGEPV